MAISVTPPMFMPWSIPSSNEPARKHVSAVGEKKTQSFGDLEESIKAAPLRYDDIPRAAQTVSEAFVDDPLYAYLINTPDAKHNSVRKAVRRIMDTASLVIMKERIALTINHGESLMIAIAAQNSDEGKRRSRANRLAGRLYMLIQKSARKLLDSPEQRKRFQELTKKISAVHEEVIGDKAGDMIYVDLVATAPAYQGRGYASTLLETVCAKADKEGREMYLNTTKMENVPFYNFNGFEIEGKVVVGVDNPTWTGPPVVCPVMVRKPNREKRA